MISYSSKANATVLDKRAAMIGEESKQFNCELATYRQVAIYNFVYEHNCFPRGWESFLDRNDVRDVVKIISETISARAQGSQIEPPMPNMFKAFSVRLEDVKAIILGQDPTPQPNKATGLAFSLKPNEDPRTVPSVINMLVELRLEGMQVSLSNGDLTPWLGQGVLLLNSALTVMQGRAGSHNRVWKPFTQLLVQHISNNAPPSAWILWGSEARDITAQSINPEKHYIRIGGHPSPMGGRRNDFFGGNYFHCANKFLAKNRGSGIDWTINPNANVGTDFARC